MTGLQKDENNVVGDPQAEGTNGVASKGVRIGDLLPKYERVSAEAAKAKLVPIGAILQAEADTTKTVRALLSNCDVSSSAQIKALISGVDSLKFAKMVTSFGAVPGAQIKQMIAYADQAKAARAVLTNAGLLSMDESGAVTAALKEAKAARAVLSGAWLPPVAQLKSISDNFADYKVARSLLSGVAIQSSAQIRKFVSSVALESKTFELLAGADDDTWEDLVSRVQSYSALSKVEIDVNATLPSVVSSADAEVAEALASGGGLSGLSSAANIWLVRIFWVFMLLQSYFAAQNGVREELCFLQPKLMPSLSIGKTGKAIRSAVCESEHPVEILKSFRLVRGIDVNLREGPSMKDALVQVHLENHAVLEVLDDSNRDWLLVSVVGQENVTGWISRKYTRTLYR